MQAGIREFLRGTFVVSQLWNSPMTEQVKATMQHFIQNMSPGARATIEQLPRDHQRAGGQLFANGWLGGYNAGMGEHGLDEDDGPPRRTTYQHMQQMADSHASRN